MILRKGQPPQPVVTDPGLGDILAPLARVALQPILDRLAGIAVVVGLAAGIAGGLVVFLLSLLVAP